MELRAQIKINACTDSDQRSYLCSEIRMLIQGTLRSLSLVLGDSLTVSLSPVNPPGVFPMAASPLIFLVSPLFEIFLDYKLAIFCLYYLFFF